MFSENKLTILQRYNLKLGLMFSGALSFKVVMPTSEIMFNV